MQRDHVDAGESSMMSRRQVAFLFVVGVALSIASFLIVALSPNPVWHPGRDAELNATFQAFKETGVFLIKHVGSGWMFAGSSQGEGFTAAVWDDDPGSYIAASLMGSLFDTSSPYPGLKLLVALIVAAPLVWLPYAVARLFKQPLAGYFVIAAPFVFWLVNYGSPLIGTQYAMSDSVSTLPVYALYGLASALVFLSLSLLLLLLTHKLSIGMLIIFSVSIGVLAGISNLTRSLSGIGVALAVGFLWWVNWPHKRKMILSFSASIVAVLIAVGVQSGVMRVVNEVRADALGQTVSELPVSHGTWHPLYLGLSYPQPISGEASEFGIIWADEFGLEQAKKVKPDVVFGTEAYDAVIRDLFIEEVTENPFGAAKLYVKKLLFTVQHFGGMLIVILIGFLLAGRKNALRRKQLALSGLVVAPTLLIGLIPPVLVMPMLYFMSELYAGISLLVLVSIGAVGAVFAGMRSTSDREKSGMESSTKFSETQEAT